MAMPSLEFWLTVASIVFTIITTILLLLPSQYDERNKSKDETGPRVQVLVLGDLGRSPRMQYHALSIAKHGGYVDLIGYRDSDPHPDILSKPSISLLAIPSPPRFLQTNNRALFLIYGPVKVLVQLWSLWILLGYRTKPAKWLLVQVGSFSITGQLRSFCMYKFLRRFLSFAEEKAFIECNHPIFTVNSGTLQYMR